MHGKVRIIRQKERSQSQSCILDDFPPSTKFMVKYCERNYFSPHERLEKRDADPPRAHGNSANENVLPLDGEMACTAVYPYPNSKTAYKLAPE